MSSYINAKEELLEQIKNIKEIYKADLLCASINFDGTIFFELKQGYTKEEFDLFLSSLDFEYKNGYGSQFLYGMLWMTNGVWVDREEYDGSEWWESHQYLSLIHI